MLSKYSTMEATSAEEALQLFMDHDRKIDLLVADVTLAKSSGIKVAMLLRSELTHLPVILTSGYPLSSWSRMDSADLRRLGSSWLAILQKPFPPEALLNAICELVGTAPSRVARTA